MVTFIGTTLCIIGFIGSSFVQDVRILYLTYGTFLGELWSFFMSCRRRGRRDRRRHHRHRRRRRRRRQRRQRQRRWW